MNPKKYPTLEEAETADKFQLAQWMRFLGSPGECVGLVPSGDTTPLRLFKPCERSQ